MKSLLDTPRGPERRSDLSKALRVAARAILDEAGQDAVGLREAARRVRVSARAAYRHFANKEDLLASVAAEGFRDLAAAMETGATGRDPLGRVGLAYFDFALRKRNLFRLMFGPILAERAKYPELNKAASAVFGLLQRARVSADDWPRDDAVGGMAAWGLVMACSTASSPRRAEGGPANETLIQAPAI
jgi:AcrR family transcriptional regulator